MRLIDADALIERIKYSFYPDERVSIETVTGCFLDETGCSPTVDAEPVRHGRWIKSDFLHIGANQYRCSECWEDKWWLYHFSLGDSNYCPNCGAKMQEVIG